MANARDNLICTCQLLVVDSFQQEAQMMKISKIKSYKNAFFVSSLIKRTMSAGIYIFILLIEIINSKD